MPKELTHWILADRALSCLGAESRLRRLIQDHHESYLGGAILPDTLLHPIRGPHSATARELARTFHDTDGNSFAPLIRAELCFPDGLPAETLACLLGVITHMQADIVFHPFVYALSGSAGIGRHYRLETGIDVHFLKSGGRPAVRHVADLMTPAARLAMLDCCALLFDPEGHLPRHALEQALRQHCRFQRMFSRTFWKLAVRLAARLAGSPFSEQRHLFYPLTDQQVTILDIDTVEWQYPASGEVRQTSLEQLADEAVQRIVTLFERIEEAGSLADALHDSPGENLLTGMHGACLSGIKSGATD
jgi:hypothetical protein